MANFLGGSAYAMAKDIAEGYVLVTERTYLRLLAPELDQLAFEMDRAMRDIRSERSTTSWRSSSATGSCSA